MLAVSLKGSASLPCCKNLLYFHVSMSETRMSCQKLILHLRELKGLKEVEGKNNHESKTKQRNHVNKLINCLEVKCMFVILPLSKGNCSSLCLLLDLKALSCTASPRERKRGRPVWISCIGCIFN